MRFIALVAFVAGRCMYFMTSRRVFRVLEIYVLVFNCVYFMYELVS
jgi:hypothetical protein